MRRREAGDEFDRRPLSAVAFYYAHELYLALGVPIGIVNASRGGTNIDAWMPRCGYADCDVSIKATAEYFVKAPDAWTNADKWGPITNPHQQPTVLWNGTGPPARCITKSHFPSDRSSVPCVDSCGMFDTITAFSFLLITVRKFSLNAVVFFCIISLVAARSAVR